MTVLFVSPFAPRPLYGGAVVRIHHLVLGLSQRYTLHWACRTAPGPHPGGTGASGPAPVSLILNSPSRWLQILNPLYVLKLVLVVRREHIPTIIISSIISGVHALLVQSLTGATLIYDAHNVEHVLMQRSGSQGWPVMAWFERLLCQRTSQVWCVSDVDAQLLHRRLGVPLSKLTVVPNGVDTQAGGPTADRATLGVRAGEALVLFFGVLSYAPNAEAVRILEEEIAPRLDRIGFPYRMVIAGVGATPRETGRIRYTGFIEDLLPVVRAADVVVVPVVSGSGTRIKILESLAVGTPVVSTPLGVEGLDLGLCDVRVAQTWDEFANQVASAAYAPHKLPTAAFVEKYDWGRIVERISL